MHPDWLVPAWPGLPGVRAFTTTRSGGVSEGEFGSLNLAMSPGDDPVRVAENRSRVRACLPSDPRWLRQVHGTAIADLDTLPEGAIAIADGAAVSRPGVVAAILTADCLPVVLARGDGRRVAVAHAGWRGLAAGVLEAAVESLGGDPAIAQAWLGPAIGPEAFEVGPEVREAFLAVDGAAASAFVPGAPGKWHGDLYSLARQRLARAGVGTVTGGGFCTRTDAARFFSYRRAPASGRLGTFAWIAPPAP